MKKILCIYHRVDLDGWMSAAVCQLYKERELGDQAQLDFYGFHYGDKLPDWTEYDEVWMSDISFSGPVMRSIVSHGIDLTWNDHHISAIKDVEMAFSGSGFVMPHGFRDVRKAGCELTWEYFFPGEGMPEIVRRLGRYDCFGHKGTDEEQEILEFQFGARARMNSRETCYEWLKLTMEREDTLETIEIRGDFIYKYLCLEAEGVYKHAFPITLTETVIEHDMAVDYPRQFLCVNRERFNPVNFGIDYHKDGHQGFACFWRAADGKWQFSLYNDDGLVDCSVIAKSFGGGGHKGAAGFIVENIDEIL